MPGVLHRGKRLISKGRGRKARRLPGARGDNVPSANSWRLCATCGYHEGCETEGRQPHGGVNLPHPGFFSVRSVRSAIEGAISREFSDERRIQHLDTTLMKFREWCCRIEE